MQNRQTLVYVHFRDRLDLSALHRAFPETASYIPVMENSCLISSFLTYRSVLELMQAHFPSEEYFICVASRHYHVSPSS